jgi:hypothetical protein
MPDDDRVTVREFIAELTRAANDLPEGLDSTLELSICQEEDQQFIDEVEIKPWRTYNLEAAQEAPEGPRGVVIIGHWHPGESPGKVLGAKTADMDEELRKMTEE